MGTENINKTTLRLEIDKTIQPKQFEPIKIQVSVEEAFYWTDEEDRAKKMESYRGRITEDFVKSFDHVANRIGEGNRCIGIVSSQGSLPVPDRQPVVASQEDEFNFD